MRDFPEAGSHFLQTSQVSGLPLEVTSFIGRSDELSDLENISRRSSLVTLTGTGGVGKTRLAIRLAAARAHEYPDGVQFVRLTDVSEDSLVEQFVERALRPDGNPGAQNSRSLIDILSGKRVLIVLDNCEHVLIGAARLAHEVIHRAPGVHVLATSRESLKVLGEHVFEVPPLSASPNRTDGTRAHGELTKSEAVQLFMDRADSASPGFSASTQDLDAIARLCKRLDGLPLAIELAAVRVRALSPTDLLYRHEAFLDLLTGGNTGADLRHQTLRGAIKWSFELCSDKEQELWTRLSLFAGGFEVDAVEKVCTDGMIRRNDVPIVLSGLVDKSVLSAAYTDGRVRYRMLESIRQFGLEMLNRSPQVDAWRQRHLSFYLSLAELSERQTFGAEASEANTRLQRERANLESAITYCLSNANQYRSGMKLVGTLWFFWNAQGHLRAGQFWLSRILKADSTPSPERAKCLWVLGWFEMIQGNIQDARNRLNEAISTAEIVHDRESRALAMQFLGTVEHIEGNPERAVELLDFSISEHGAQQVRGSLPILGIVQKAFIYCLTESSDLAVELSEAAISASLDGGEQFAASWAMWTKGMAHWSLGEYSEAKNSLLRAIQIKRELHDWLGVSVCLDVLAWVAVRNGEMAKAATLWGEGRFLYGEMGSIPLFGSAKHVEIREAHQAEAKAALGPEKFAKYFENASQGVDLTGTDQTRPVTTADSVTLTNREREISELVAREMSNKEIAAQLVLSVRTVEGHVQNILKKLGFRSRQQLCRWVESGGSVR
ncbi:LuxR C-terminal-related transcriptional regulator [Dietzia psychralcaliphila]|uniref:LuxR C-terminal-related transcriptional regulator n=1 Tax=Dietzia psychralcaliphila TaxID=139021 RepID=UPI001C1E69D7|nr:LuxR C-terminal-related transcriptional regulator [Dietzia psychralcaliphila]